MLKTKIFVKKTRRGGVVRVVREHYLRDDIYCGAAHCNLCEQEKRVLERCPISYSALCKFPHYIIPDTNVVLHQVLHFMKFQKIYEVFDRPMLI